MTLEVESDPQVFEKFILRVQKKFPSYSHAEKLPKNLPVKSKSKYEGIMEEYLRCCNDHIKKLAADQDLHVVIGNEACDLDSAVTAIVYAFYLSQCFPEEIVVPVLNINKEDYRLRTEVTYYLSLHGIAEDTLLFRDQLDLHSYHQRGRLKLTLVDFNVFRGDDTVLEDAVTEVIDHHQQERQEKPGVSVTLELVGSCCTLVAEKLMGNSSFSMNEKISSLLYGGIVLDTVCLAPEAGRTTPKDETYVTKLEALIPQCDRKKTFEELQTAKADVSALSTIDVLRKDMKKISSSKLAIAISSIPIELQTFLAGEGVLQNVRSFCSQQHVDVVVLMTLYLSADGAAHRQIAVFSTNQHHRDQITALLTSSQDPDLQLEPLSTTSPYCRVFSQINLTASRKKVLPLLQTYVNADRPLDSGSAVDLTSSVSLEQTSTDWTDLHRLAGQSDEVNKNNVAETITTDLYDNIGDLDFSLVTGDINHCGDVGDNGLSETLFDISPLVSSMSTPDRQHSHPATPPNTYTDSHLDSLAHDHLLPSFNSREMVRKIQEKKELLQGAIGEDEVDESGDSCPYTPNNSVTDSSLHHLAHEHNLPSFYNPEMVNKIRKKRSDIDLEMSEEELKPGSVPLTPPNSYAESPMDGAKPARWEIGRDFLGKVEEEVRRRSVTGEMDIQQNNESHGNDLDIHMRGIGNVVAYHIAQEMIQMEGRDDKEDEAVAGSSSDYAFTNPGFQSDYSPDSLTYHGSSDMDVAYQIAQEIIQKALETYTSSLSEEELEEFANREYHDGTDTVETEYLSKLDPFKGKPDLLGSLPTTSRELAESESFNRLQSLSHDEDYPPDVCGAVSLQGTTDGESSTDPGYCPPLELEEVVVTESSTDSYQRQEAVYLAGATTEESSTDQRPRDDSDLSEGVQELLDRLRSQSGASATSDDTNEDPMETLQRIESARYIVDQALKQAYKIYQRELSMKMADEEGDQEELKRLRDQIPETRHSPDGMRTPPRKKKIMPNMDLLKDMSEELSSGMVPASPTSSDPDILSMEEAKTPDDLNSSEVLQDSILDGELDWDSDDEEKASVEPIPEYTAREEYDDVRNWRNVTIGNKQYRIDMKVIEPYKKVLSHGGYYGDGFNAIIVFAGCNLPDKARRDYSYVMDNLFLYVISTLELLVVEDYMMVYFHGATPKQKMPSLRWLKRCYEMIDRRLKKNLKSLLIVHPTIWLKTIVLMTKPFISSKFYQKIKYVKSIAELGSLIPMEYVYIPEEIKVADEKYRDPTASDEASSSGEVKMPRRR